MQSTFFFSNIAPQVGQGFNRDAWNQLEGYVRRLTKAYVHVHVCSGRKLSIDIRLFLMYTWYCSLHEPYDISYVCLTLVTYV